MEKKRFPLLDSIRGTVLVSMIIYHATWNFVYIYGMDWPWYQSKAAYVWQQSICWTFILLSGFCFSLGQRHLKSGLMVFGGGALVTLVTLIAMPQNRVVFGVLTCIGSCILLVAVMEKIIRKIADNGACVIVGRASDYILRDYKNVINIFIYAPLEFRVNNIMEMYNDDLNNATEHVKKSDHSRSLYYRNISGKKWNDPKNYTMCIDSSIGMDLCVEQICNLYNSLNK